MRKWMQGLTAPVLGGIAVSCVAARADATSESREGFEALVSVVGNTITAAVPGGHPVIYLAKDGTLVGVIDGRKLNGKWSFTDGKLCLVKGSGGKSECGTIKVSGSAGSFTVDGHDIALKIEPGNKVDAATPAAPVAAGATGGAGKLTGAPAAAALVGNTIEGKIAEKGQTTVFLHNDGTVAIRQGTSTIKGKWSVDGETMCIDVERHKDCFTVAIDGSRVTWIAQKGKDNPPLEFTLLKGNARNL